MGLNPLSKFIIKRPWLHKMILPLAKAHTNMMGYRKLGLRYDDIIDEDRVIVQEALKRLPPRVLYDRVYRIRRAAHLSMAQKILPKSQWTTEKEDTLYLTPILDQLEAEMKEKADLDSITLQKSH